MLSAVALTTLLALAAPAPVAQASAAVQVEVVTAQAQIIRGARISLRSGVIESSDGSQQAQPQRRIRNGEPLVEFL